MKIAPIHKRMQATAGLVPVLVHTGQHYGGAMSRVFFEELGLPEPDIPIQSRRSSTCACIRSPTKAPMPQIDAWEEGLGRVDLGAEVSDRA